MKIRLKSFKKKYTGKAAAHIGHAVTNTWMQDETVRHIFQFKERKSN
jgi:hypothetical protein